MLLNPYRFVTGPSDPYWSNVISLLNFEDTGNPTSFIDDKSKTWTINNNGSPTIASGGGLHLPRDIGSSIYRVLSNEEVILSSDDFTIEVHCKFLEFAEWQQVVFSTRSGDYDIGLIYGATWNVWINQAGHNLGSTTPIPIVGNVYHIALVRKSGNTRLYVNGIQQTAGLTQSTPITVLRIGHSGIPWELYRETMIYSYRITKGVARYDGSFTPPSYPFPIN